MSMERRRRQSNTPKLVLALDDQSLRYTAHAGFAVPHDMQTPDTQSSHMPEFAAISPTALSLTSASSAYANLGLATSTDSIAYLPDSTDPDITGTSLDWMTTNTNYRGLASTSSLYSPCSAMSSSVDTPMTYGTTSSFNEPYTPAVGRKRSYTYQHDIYTTPLKTLNCRPTVNEAGASLSRHAAGLTNEHIRKMEKEIRLNAEEKTHSYAQLITFAIARSETGKLTLSEIYDWFLENFPYYETHTSATWRNSIRHNLSVGKNFLKVPRPVWESGKGSYWTLRNPSNAVHDATNRVRKRSYSASEALRSSYAVATTPQFVYGHPGFQLEAHPVRDANIQSSPHKSQAGQDSEVRHNPLPTLNHQRSTCFDRSDTFNQQNEVSTRHAHGMLVKSATNGYHQCQTTQENPPYPHSQRSCEDVCHARENWQSASHDELMVDTPCPRPNYAGCALMSYAM